MRYYFAFFLFTLSCLYAEQQKKSCEFTPNFYGTLLEFPADNNDPGVITLEPYLYGGYSYGFYNDNWSLIHTNQYGIITPQLFAYIGVTKWLELGIMLQSQTIFFNDHSSTNFGDSALNIFFQVLWDKKNTPQPDVTFLLGEVFPTGKYRNLGPTFGGNNSTGLGAYGTIVGFILEKIFYVFPCHPFNINFNIVYTYYTKTNVHGINAFGGGANTHGTARPGSPLLIALALEYCFTQKYIFALDIQYTHTFAPQFKGSLGFNPDGTVAAIATSSKDLFTLTPAIEFGITPSMCIYLGGYFTIAGRNTQASAEGNITFEIDF